MTYSYYPGCTLKNKAADLDRYGRISAEALGVTLEELPEWQCCGGVYSIAKDETASKLPAVRALVSARDRGQELITLCSACHNVIKQVNNDMRTNETIRFKANTYLKLEKEYQGETEVLHYLEMLRDKIGFSEIRKRVVKPFTGVKIAAYYGCLLLRPGKIMQFDNPENPSVIEDFIKAIGGTPVKYPMRNECCGGYVTMEDKNLAVKKSSRVIESAEEFGADLMVTACPLCLYNLTKNSRNRNIPVKYFTELLAEALGLKEQED